MSLKRILSVKNLKPLWEETVMVRQCTNSRVLCCYKLEDNEMDDDEKAHLKARLDLLLTIRHQGMRLIYEPTNPPYLFYAYCGGGSLQDAFKSHILHETKFTRDEILDILYQLTSFCLFLYESNTGVMDENSIIIDPRCIYYDDYGILRVEFGCPMFKMIHVKKKFRSNADVGDVVMMTSLPLPGLFYDMSGSVDPESTLNASIFNRRDNFSDIASDTSLSVSEFSIADSSVASDTHANPTSNTQPNTQSSKYLHDPLTSYRRQATSCDICHHDRYVPPEYYNQQRDTPCGVVWSIGRLLYDACQLTGSIYQTTLSQINKEYYTHGLDREYGDELAILLRSMMQTNYQKRPTLKYILNLPLLRCTKRNFEQRHGIVRTPEGNTQLMVAALEGDITSVKRYLYQRCHKNNQGETALMLALKYMHEEAGLILSDEECGFVDNEGNFAAKYALSNGIGSAFQKLSVTEKFLLIKHGITHLMIAAANGDISGVSAYLDGNVGLVLNGPGTTALMMAASTGSIECVEQLAAYEARIQDTKGMTAMMHAALHAQTDVVSFLSQYEANYLDNNGTSTLIHAVYEHERMKEKIRQETKAIRPGNIGPWSARCGQMLYIISHLASLEARHRVPGGYSALMLAAQYGNIRAVESLIKYEGGLQADDGTTALMLAIRYGYTSIAKMILPIEAGLTTNNKSSQGDKYTALMEAAVQGDLEIVNALAPKEINIVQPPTKAFPSGKTATDWGTESTILTDTKTKQDVLFALMIYQERVKLADSPVQKTFTEFIMLLSPFIVILVMLLRKYIG